MPDMTPIRLECHACKDGQGFKIEVTVTGMKTAQQASVVGDWIRKTLQDNIGEIGFLAH